jgi:GNAT superfamily N-acetyltransferase
MLSDGFHAVPPGKVAMVVTHLEMRAAPKMRPAALPGGVTFHPVTPDADWFRDIFLRVGGMEWLWFGRLGLSGDALAAILNDPAVKHYTLRKDGRDEALLELDFRAERACELSYFGLTPALIGTGSGRYLMNEAIARAWSRPIDRFHVHTCTLDSPQALTFYRRSGFTPVRQEVEIADDPRLAGILPREAAPHVPVFDG